MPLSVGDRLARYEIRGFLGAGGMGEVYRAYDQRLDRDVAIKILPEAYTADADRLMRFEREAKLLASLNHPAIAQIYDLVEAGDRPYLVLELVQGRTLRDLLGDGLLGAYGVGAILSDEEIRDALTVVALCANDPVSAWGGVELLRKEFSIEPALVTGPATDNEVGVQQIDELLEGARVPRGFPALEQLEVRVFHEVISGVLSLHCPPPPNSETPQVGRVANEISAHSGAFSVSVLWW